MVGIPCRPDLLLDLLPTEKPAEQRSAVVTQAARPRKAAGIVGQSLLERWTQRRALLRLTTASGGAVRPGNAKNADLHGHTEEAPEYLCLKQMSQAETQTRQLRQEAGTTGSVGGEPSHHWQWLRSAPSAPAPIARFVGNLGPSLFMTAVERRDQQQKGREELERLGRAVNRVLGMTAEERARNDLPPRMTLREALANGLLAVGSDGLDPCAKSAHTPQTYGWRGLTTAGRRAIKDAAAVMDEHYGTLGFWTVTLPEATAAVATRDQVAEFQTRLLFFARRMMLRRGVEPFAVVVAELHPHRRAMDGARVPHWHAIVKVSSLPFSRWAVSVADWHRVVAAAHRSAFGQERGTVAGCKMLPQKTGAARYLAKYMSKDRSEVAPLRGTQAGRMVPRQWWTWTGEVRAAVMACRLRPPSGFLSWCCRWWQELIDLGEVVSSDAVQIGEDGPMVGRWFVWACEEALDRAMERWTGEELARLDWLSTG